MSSFLLRRALVVLVAAAVVGSGVAAAQETEPTTLTFATAQLTQASPAYSLARPDFRLADQIGVSVLSPRIVERPRTSPTWKSTMLLLDAMTFGTQLADFHSTRKALQMGGVEANPIMKSIVKNPGVFLGTKLGVAAGLALATHNLARHNKVAAVVASVAANSVYAYIAQRNYRVARAAGGR